MELIKNGMVLDGHGATLQGNGASSAIHVGAFTNITIKNLKIEGFATGVLAEGSSSLTLTNITIVGTDSSTGTSTGLRLEKVSGSAVQGANIKSCESGAILSGCSKVTVEKCDLSHNRTLGLLLDNSSTCLIRDNRIAFTGQNSADASKTCGVDLENASNHNQLLRNIVVQGKGSGIAIGLSTTAPSTDNTLDTNDTSWNSGDGFYIKGQAENRLVGNMAAHCLIGIHLTSSSKASINGNILVGNRTSGVSDEQGVTNTYESNIFAMDTGSGIAMNFKGTSGNAAGIRLFENVFIDYAKPLRVENTSPMTLQTNTFSGAQSLEIEDLADITGPKPLALNSQNDKPKSGPFITSLGMLAALPSLYDHLCGISVSAMAKPDTEVVVEGSLTGAFQGEEEILARYKGELPVEITFPPRTITNIRIKGVPQTPAAFLVLMGDQSLAKGKEAEDSSDTISVPNEAVDGDTQSVDHGWRPKFGKAGEWWQVDLKSIQTLTAFAIHPEVRNPNSFWSKFHIQTSPTGEFKGEETNVITETNWSAKPGPVRTYRISPIAARFVRVVSDVDQEGVILSQFGVYGLSH